MASFISHTTVDCHHAYELSEWWKPVLGYVDMEDDPNLPGHDECMIRDPESGHLLLFIEVPDAELPAKRIHFDLIARSGSRDAEIERVRGLGAIEVKDRRGECGRGWVTFADPEGNQFCLIRSESERAEASTV